MYNTSIIPATLRLMAGSCLLLAAGFTAGCDSNEPDTDRTTAPVLTFDTQDETGTSSLTRTDDGISYSLSATGLEPGMANTLWVVIFNEPENCDPAGCGEPDLFTPEVMADVVFGGDGHVIGSSGEATFTGSYNAGSNSGSVMGEWLDLPENGLMNPRTAEIHLIVHSHGPVIEELEAEMISTFNAGCGPDFMEGAPPVPESLGTYGPNTCTDKQFAVHKPRQAGAAVTAEDETP